MLFLIVLLCLITIIVLWVIFMPLVIKVNSDESIYEVRQWGTFLVKVEFDEIFRFYFYLFGFEIPKGTENKKRDSVPIRKAKKKTFLKGNFTKWKVFIGNLRKAISVKRLVLDVDTGDVVLNAQAIPALYFLNSRRVTLSTNFIGRVFVEFIAYIYLHRVLWAFIKFKLK
jgi:hypothetical protein